MDEKLYDALEVCLNALETGVDIESVLKLYPQLAEELRPALEASLQARRLALPDVPEVVIQRGRARVLQYATEMRKLAPGTRKRWSMFTFPRLAASLAIAFIFLLSGTGLVSASNGALPGDQLYPVKRSWEGLRLFFVFSPEEREGLESEFEQERLDEISELLTKERDEPIAFAGLVIAQNSDTWKVSGITVLVTPSTHLPSGPVAIGAPVMVIGHTNARGYVEAASMEVLGAGASLPPLEPSQGESAEIKETEDLGGEPGVNNNQQSEQPDHKQFQFQGIVESMNGHLWTINGQEVNVESAENTSPVSVGALVEFEGYYSTNGQFIVTKIEVKSSGLFKGEQLNSSGKGSDGNGGKKDGSGDDSSGGQSGNGDEGEDGHEENEGGE